MNTPRKNCGRNDCRFLIEAQSTTMLHNPVIGDPDPNTTNGRMRCLSCEKRWLFTQNYQGTQFTEIKAEVTND